MSSEPLLTFPRWANRATIAVLAVVVLAPAYAGALLYYGANATSLSVGYQPVQPVPYSHALHAGKLGIDCRYCHWSVERASMAALPSTEVCMNCHTAIFPNSAKLAEVRRSNAEGTPIAWLKVHDLPDYVYFDHSAHLTAGVGCIECHGPVHQMEEVRQVKPLNMAWCLECHRRPEPFLRPKDQLTNMDWSPSTEKDAPTREALGRELRASYHVNPSTDCVTCHR
jgi:menaquinone reductase, multiheme cytochrome c subunit